MKYKSLTQALQNLINRKVYYLKCIRHPLVADLLQLQKIAAQSHSWMIQSRKLQSKNTTQHETTRLVYNARQHEYNTTQHKITQVQHEATQVQHDTTRVQHETTRVQHDTTRVQNNVKFVLIYSYHSHHCMFGALYIRL